MEAEVVSHSRIAYSKRHNPYDTPLANMNFVIPGPTIGVIVGLVILGLGVAKGIRTARAVTVPTPM